MRKLRPLTALVALALIAGCSSSSSSEPSTMPDVVGERLDTAKSDLDAAGIDDVEVVGGGTFGIVVESNWTVCEQRPDPGSTAEDVRVIVDRECEGGEGGAETDTTDTSPPSTTTSPPTTRSSPTTDAPSRPAARPVAEAEAAWLAVFGISQPVELLSLEGYDPSIAPLHAIVPGWGGSTDGYLRITVQEPLDDAQVRALCINVLNLIGPEFREIDGVVFTDSSGLDNNCFRSDAPGADL